MLIVEPLVGGKLVWEPLVGEPLVVPHALSGGPLPLLGEPLDV